MLMASHRLQGTFRNRETTLVVASLHGQGCANTGSTPQSGARQAAVDDQNLKGRTINPASDFPVAI
jgi:hypothetical protein